MKVKFSFILVILSVLFFSCSNIISEPEEGSVTVDVAKVASYISRNSFRKGDDGDEGDFRDMGLPDMKNFVSEFLFVRLSTEGEYKANTEKQYPIDYERMASYEDYNQYYLDLLKQPITLSSIPVGSKIIVTASIGSKVEIDEAMARQLFVNQGIPAEYLDDTVNEMKKNMESEVSFADCSSEEFIVQSGDNHVKIILKPSEDDFGKGPDDGREKEGHGKEDSGEEGKTGGEGIHSAGEIDNRGPGKWTIEINSSKSDKSFFLNKGTLCFNLMDEEGNNFAEGDYDSSTASGTNADWTFELRFGSTVIPTGALTPAPYYTSSAGKIEIQNMPTAGTYQLYVQANPKDEFSNFETSSAVFNLTVENTTYYSFSVDSNDSNYINFDTEVSNTNRDTLSNANTNIHMKLSGSYSGSMSQLFKPDMRDYLSSTFEGTSYMISIDASEITVSGSKAFEGYEFQNLTMLTSVILPETIEKLSVSVFQGCTNLQKVEFVYTEGWHKSASSLNLPINWEEVELETIDVSDPSANAEHLKNNDWGYIYRKTE